MSDLPDDRLVELTRQNNLSAFEALMRRHNRRLFRVARSVLRDSEAAEDAVQEAYLRAYTKLGTYEPVGKFAAWLTRIALNESLMMRRRTRGDTVSLEQAGDEASIAEEAAAREAPTADVRSKPLTRCVARARDRRVAETSAWCRAAVVEGREVRRTRSRRNQPDDGGRGSSAAQHSQRPAGACAARAGHLRFR